MALTLYGVSLVRESVMHAFGPQLRLFIEKSTKRRWQAFCSGILVTSLIQSSTATILIVTGFAARQLITLGPALAVSLGADVGTTLVAQVLSIGVHWLGPVFVLVGMVGAGWFPNGRIKHVGIGFIGLGLVLQGLGTIIHAADLIEKSEVIRVLMGALASDLTMAFIVGALVTWAVQSSLAVVLLIMSFAVAGVMPLATAFALVLGTHVGSSITPLLVNLKQKNEALQIAWGNLLMRLVSCLLAVPFLHVLVNYAPHFGHNTGKQIINFHTLFSVARACLFLPLIGLIERGLKKALPFTVDTADGGHALYLDDRDLATPSVALASAAREALRLGDQVIAMLNDVKGLFVHNSPYRLQRLLARDNQVDTLYDTIKFYLAKLSREAMDDTQAKRHVDLLMFITNLEHIGDIIVHNLCELSAKKWRNNLTFSRAGWDEIEAYHARVCDNFHLAMNVFATQDPKLARQLVKQKEAIRRETITTTGSHFDRLRQGLLESMRSSSLHLDIIRDLRRINDHITTVAYGILEARGDLQSRLRDEDVVVDVVANGA